MALPEALRSPHSFDGDSTVAVGDSPFRRARTGELLEGDPTLQLPRSRFRAVPSPAAPVAVPVEPYGDSTLPLRPDGQALGPLAFTAGEPRDLPMRCLYCQGRIERGTAPVAVGRSGCRLHLEAVPAWVCTGCTEAYFESREVELIRRALGTVRELRPALRH